MAFNGKTQQQKDLWNEQYCELDWLTEKQKNGFIWDQVMTGYVDYTGVESPISKVAKEKKINS